MGSKNKKKVDPEHLASVRMSNPLESESIIKLLLKFSLPAIVGMIVQAVYNIVDRIFIGQAPELGQQGLAAIVVCYPVMLITIAFSLLIAAGGATCFSIYWGRKEDEEAGRYQGTAFTLSVLFGLAVSALGLWQIDRVLYALGASEDILPLARDYLSIIFYGTTFSFVSMFGNNFSRAQGNPKNAMVSMFIGAGFNIVFDYILIIKMGMGMKGAALATIGGQFLSMVWQLAYIFGKRCIIPLKLKDMSLVVARVLQIFKTGIPVFIVQISGSIMTSVLTVTTAQYGGDLALAAISVITSLQMMIQMPIVGILQGQQPIISFNYGAKRLDRMKETLKYASIFATSIALFGFIVIQLFPSALVHMFSKEQELQALAVSGLRIWFIVLPVIGIQAVMANFFQSIGKVLVAGFLNLLPQVLLLVPAIIVLAKFFGVQGIFYSAPFSQLGALLISLPFLFSQIKKLENELLA